MDRRVIYLRPAQGSRIDQQIGARLAKLRVGAGISLGDMAGRLGISIGRMVLLETGDRRASPEVLMAACSILKVSIADIYAGALLPAAE